MLVEVVDGLCGGAEIAARGVLVGKRDARDTRRGGGLDSAHVVLDRDGVGGADAETLQCPLVTCAIGFRMVDRVLHDDDVERLGADMRLEGRQERIDVGLRRGGHQAEPDPLGLRAVDRVDNTWPRRHAGVGKQLLEDLRFGRVDGGRVHIGPDRLRVVADAVGAAVAVQHGAVLLL